MAPNYKILDDDVCIYIRLETSKTIYFAQY